MRAAMAKKLNISEEAAWLGLPMAGMHAPVLVFLALDCAIETTRLMSCDASSGRVCLDACRYR
jgi:hypothetical protein